MGPYINMNNNSDMIHKLEYGTKEILLIGTAHVSRESTELVKETIAAEKPDTVCVELCESRYQSIRQKDRSAKTPHRTQNRLSEKFPYNIGTYSQGKFNNEPNTDWSLSANREWAEKIRQKWQKSPEDNPLAIPIVVNGLWIGRRSRVPWWKRCIHIIPTAMLRNWSR